MLILGDESARRSRIPWVTGSLILLNVLAFLTQKWIGDRITYGFSLVPYEITHLKDLTKPQKIKAKVPVPHPDPRLRDYVPPTIREMWVEVPQYRGPFPIVLTLLTSMFLHGDWMHLIGNMWFLAIFGRNVESAWNHGRFLLFYLTCGVVGGLCQVFSDPSSVVPCLGASGAISGVMGAYVAVYPLNKVKLWFGWYIGVVEVPALVVIGIWFLWQYISVFVDMEMGQHLLGGVAYWDHLGGFAAGLVLVWGTVFFLRRQIGDDAPPEPEAEPAAAEAASTPAAPPMPQESGQAAETFARAATLGPAGTVTPRPDPFANALPAAKPPAPYLPTPSDPFGEYAPSHGESEPSKRYTR
jgi:membrane associated rhomboid family serine protease